MLTSLSSLRTALCNQLDLHTVYELKFVQICHKCDHATTHAIISIIISVQAFFVHQPASHKMSIYTSQLFHPCKNT